MNLFIATVLLIIGLIFLIKGADFLVDGSSSLAKRFSIPEIVIGLTIVAFGTSMPELIVNIISSLGGKSDIALANIVGSNIFNILFILGITGLMHPIAVQKNTALREIPFSLATILILVILVNDKLIFRASKNALSFRDGIILLGFLVLFLIYVYYVSKKSLDFEEEIVIMSLSKTILFIIIGFVGLFIGGNLVVDNAVIIATALKVSEKLIAITIIAGGTSLPELVTSCVAATKCRNDIAIGNIVGSNIFNILLILGISSIIGEMVYKPSFNFDLIVLIGATILLFLTMFTGKKYKLDRWESVIFLLGYICYVACLIIRG